MQKKDLKTGMLVKTKNNIYKAFMENQIYSGAYLVREDSRYLELPFSPEDSIDKLWHCFTVLEVREPSYPPPTKEQFKRATQEDLQEEFSKAKILWPKPVNLDKLNKNVEEVFKIFKEIIDNKP